MVTLELEGLVLGSRDPRTSRNLHIGEAHFCHIPAEIIPKLPPPERLPVDEEPRITQAVAGDAAALSRDLYFLFSHVCRHRPALTRSLRMTKRAMKALLPEISCSADLKTVQTERDIPRLWFLKSLLIHLGLIRAATGRDSSQYL